MNEVDRQIVATLQALVALQGAKIIQVERENADLKVQLAALRKCEAERVRSEKVEVQA